VVNETLVEAESGRDDVAEVRVRCAELARQAGNESLGNMVALGALIGALPVVAPESVRAALRRLVAKRPELLEAELRAFAAGLGVRGSRAGVVGRAAFPGADARRGHRAPRRPVPASGSG
jgi:Pyruvate/2-oxoacid:ferredoxin oxidoreductase gamma subunit